MSNVIERVHLIKSDPVKNNNKFWIGELHDDDTVHCRWGRVGDEGQSNVKDGGKRFLDQKVSEKMRDGRNGEIGYRKVDIIDSDVSTTQNKTLSSTSKDLSIIAKKQIIKSSTNRELINLIDFFTKQNVHNIVTFSGGNIQYNYDSGTFKTAMGMVSQSTVDEARYVLDGISDCVINKNYGEALMKLHRDYCMLIPQDIGRKRIELSDFWVDISKVQTQSQVLDGLQASLVSASKPSTDNKPTPIEEQVFDTELDIVSDDQIKNRIFTNYLNMRSRQHSCYDYKPINLWSIHIRPMRKAFQNHGAKMTNIIEGYHGTGSENALSLLKTGFLVRPPSKAAISGKMFGTGVYTAPCHIAGSSTKSTNYAIGFWGGRSSERTFNFVCDVAMGKYHTPKGPYSGPPTGYDSCWAKGNHVSGVLNDETIVYKESQIDIKYLIELKK